MTSPIQDSLWLALVNLVPEASKLGAQDRSSLCGWVRRSLLAEAQDEEDSQAIFRQNDVIGLRQLIQSLPCHTPAEITQAVEELDLTSEEAALEISAWPIRRQSRSGDLLLDEKLVPFKLIRIKTFSYILLSHRGYAQVTELFSRAFGQPAHVAATEAFHIEEQVWSAWAWLLDPNAEAAALEAAQLRQIWAGNQP